MKCYRCEKYVLKPTKLATGLPAKCCSNCSGLLIDLLSYRSWRDEQRNTPKPTKNSTPQEPTSVEEGKKALSCQRCSKIMLRYRISAHYENYVDLCSTCDTAWLDHGEWDLLRYLDAEGKLTKIMTAPWQSRLRDEEMESIKLERLVREIGEDGVSRLQEFVQWFSELDENEAAARYLREKHVP